MENYFSMKLGYFRSKYKAAVVQLLNAEYLDLDHHDKATSLPFSVPDEFRISFTGINKFSFSRSHYLLPDACPNLKKIVVLDDNVVVQQDLPALWGISLGQLRSLGRDVVDKNSCAWMYGLNLIDLERWRELKLSQTYGRFTRQATRGSQLPLRNLAELPELNISARQFVDGLGHNYGLNAQVTWKAAVLHYNGAMKPWLYLGIPKYKDYWRKYLNRDDQSLSDCSVNP